MFHCPKEQASANWYSLPRPQMCTFMMSGSIKSSTFLPSMISGISSYFWDGSLRSHLHFDNTALTTPTVLVNKNNYTCRVRVREYNATHSARRSVEYSSACSISTSRSVRRLRHPRHNQSPIRCTTHTHSEDYTWTAKFRPRSCVWCAWGQNPRIAIVSNLTDMRLGLGNIAEFHSISDYVLRLVAL